MSTFNRAKILRALPIAILVVTLVTQAFAKQKPAARAPAAPAELPLPSGPPPTPRLVPQYMGGTEMADLSFSRDGRYLVTRGEKTLLFDLRAGILLQTKGGGSAAIAPAADRFLAEGKLRSVADETEQGSLRGGLLAAFSPEGDKLVRVDVVPLGDWDTEFKFVVELVDVKSNAVLARNAQVSCAHLDYAADGQTILCGGTLLDANTPYAAIEGLFDGVRARKRLLLIDTCHSGEVDKSDTLLLGGVATAAPKLVMRGVKKVASKTSADAVRVVSELFADIGVGTGATAIASSSGTEFALESSEWKGGVFSYAVRQGLSDKRADLDHDGAVRVLELKAYVTDLVLALTRGQQTPTTRRDNPSADFVLVR
jgi:hypothetical protein